MSSARFIVDGERNGCPGKALFNSIPEEGDASANGEDDPMAVDEMGAWVRRHCLAAGCSLGCGSLEQTLYLAGANPEVAALAADKVVAGELLAAELLHG